MVRGQLQTTTVQALGVLHSGSADANTCTDANCNYNHAFSLIKSCEQNTVVIIVPGGQG